MDTLNDRKKNLALHVAFIIGLLIVICVAVTDTAAADEEIDMMNALQDLEINSTSELFITVFRILGFGIIKLLGSAADACYEGLATIYGALDFTHSAELIALNERYSFMYKIVFLIAIAILGLYLIGRNSNSQLNVTTCIMLMAVIIIAMPLFTEKLADLTKASAAYAQEQWSDSADGMNLDSISGTIVDDYIIDLEKVDKNISQNNIGVLKNAVNDRSGYNNIDESTDDWRHIDINSVMDYNDDSFENDFWDKKIEKNEEGYVLEELSTWVPFMDTYYYRYQMSSWIEPIMMLLILSGVLILTGLRCALLIVGIAMAEIYLPFISASDIASGQRTKEAIKHFFTLFGCIFLCIALLGVYFIGYKWINTHITMILPKLIFQIALAWKVIDGPNLIERILGVDVGVREGWKTLLGLKAAGDMAKGAGKAAKYGAGATKRGAAKAGTGMKNVAGDAYMAMKNKGNKANAEAAKWKQTGGDPMEQSGKNGSESKMPGGAATQPQTDKSTEGNVAMAGRTAQAKDNAGKGKPDPMSKRQNATAGGKNGSAAQPGKSNGKPHSTSQSPQPKSMNNLNKNVNAGGNVNKGSRPRGKDDK